MEEEGFDGESLQAEERSLASSLKKALSGSLLTWRFCVRCGEAGSAVLQAGTCQEEMSREQGSAGLRAQERPLAWRLELGFYWLCSVGRAPSTASLCTVGTRPHR